MRVLLAEDDANLADAIFLGLKHYGHTVDHVDSGTAVVEAVCNLQENFDAIILDLGLPGMDGMEALRKIRAKSITTPVIILTARDTLTDRVNGLDAGSDDYMTKPFELEELAARLRAVQRRNREQMSVLVKHNDISLDPASHTVKKGDDVVAISRREFALLQKLLENSGRVISREQLNQTLYGWGENIDSNALEVHVHNLRKRLGTKLIRTIRGVGYMVDKPDLPA
jgi:two-component system, OmpR family, response regulator QseB